MICWIMDTCICRDSEQCEDYPIDMGCLFLVDERTVISDACRGCGRCVDVCLEGAIELSIEHSQFVEQSIARISPLVDVS